MGNRVMLSLPELWGDDSKEFKPERASGDHLDPLTRAGWLDIPDGALRLSLNKLTERRRQGGGQARQVDALVPGLPRTPTP